MFPARDGYGVCYSLPFREGLGVGSYQIRNQKRRAATFLGVGKELQRRIDIRTRMLRFETQQLADDMQHVRFTFLGRNEFLDLIGEEDHAHFIVVLDRGESECSSYFGHRVAFHLAHRTEVAAAADIDEQHHR